MSDDFRELKSPEEGIDGWYVAAKYSAWWLNIHGEISNDTSDDGIKLLYHKTEGDAYRALAHYYDKHKRGHAVGCTKALQSQVMTFT